MEKASHRVYGQIKQSLFKKLPQTIVEIGAGCGANFRYYSPGTHVIAIEPNQHMHPFLQKRAAQCDLNLEIIAERGESISMANESADAVVMTLVLCTVDSPERVVSEIHRILRPKSALHFIEHVSAKPVWYRIYQSTLYFPWRICFDGCRLKRDSERELGGGGFDLSTIDRQWLTPLMIPIAPHIFGSAVKQAG